jgi:hypothetical protein
LHRTQPHRNRGGSAAVVRERRLRAPRSRSTIPLQSRRATGRDATTICPDGQNRPSQEPRMPASAGTPATATSKRRAGAARVAVHRVSRSKAPGRIVTTRFARSPLFCGRHDHPRASVEMRTRTRRFAASDRDSGAWDPLAGR